MKLLPSRFYLVCALTLSALTGTAAPLGTAFTYQGRLHDGAQPATGIYDLRFTIYDALSGGGPVGGSLTNAATGVTNGLFNVALDFGATAFDGSARWLALEVRTNGGGAFIPLNPRQPLNPAPNATYATQAGTAASATTAATANAVAAGSVGTAGLATGAVDSSRITDGTIGVTDLSPAVLSNTFWRLGGNRSTAPGTDFLGTADNQSLEFKVNGLRALRLEPTATSEPNIVAGHSANLITGGVGGATIAGGGGASGWQNSISAGANYGTIGGGRANAVAAQDGTVAGGGQNKANGDKAAVGGGYMNRADASAATVSGGYGSQAAGAYSAVGGGFFNTVSNDYATIAGGRYNTNLASNGFIGGGEYNRISAPGATVPGGQRNTASGASSFAAGQDSTASGNSAVAMGFTNLASGDNSVSLGSRNTASGFASTALGDQSLASGMYSAAIGYHTRATGIYSAALNYNTASGGFGSLAAGTQAKAIHDGTFVWADHTYQDFASTSPDQFIIRAGGGVGIGTNNPQAALHVRGTVRADSFQGSGASLTSLNGSALADNSITAAKFAPGAVNHLDAPDGSPTAALQVNTNGLVGIGTNAPQAGLDIQASGTVIAPRVLFEVDVFSSDTYTNLGNVKSVAVEGNLVALGAASAGVTLVDVTDPQAPVLRWQVRDGTGVYTNIGQVGAVALRSNLLAIASWTDDALTLVDISNVTNPVKVAELRDGVNGWNDLAWGEAVTMSGNLLAVASRSESAVTLADIAVPANPVRRYVFKQGVNTYTNVAGPMAVAFSGNLLAIGSWSNSAVTLVDVSTPASPIKRAELVNGVGGFTHLSGVQGLSFSGNLLAIAAAQANAVTLVDVSNPSAPVLKSVIRNGVDGVTTLGEPQGVALAGNRLVVSGFRSNAVTLFDISDVTHPRLLAAARHRIGGADYLAGAWGVAFAGTNVAVAAYYSSAFTMLEFAPQPAGLVSQGWVGIGTRNPDAPLHVVGNVLVEQAQFFNVNASRLALGVGNQTSGRDAIAIGHENTASGWESVALGSDVEASGWGAMALGNQARAMGNFSVALGSSAYASGANSLAFGYAASAGGDSSVVLGPYSHAWGDHSVAMGNSASATADDAFALGAGTWATNFYSTALGHLTISGGYASTAMGQSTKALGQYSTAMGNDTTASESSSMAAGYRARATNEGAFAWADSTEADFGSTGRDQFLIRASGGVGINTNNPNGAALNVAGTVRARTFQGDGAGLTGVSVNGNNISSGTINDARLSSNVALRSGGNSFSGAQVISSGSLRMSDQDIFLRGGADAFHGLGWYGAGKLFAGYDVNGPVLYGAGNGALGTRGATTNVALFWTGTGSVGIGGIPQDARLDVQGNIRLNNNDLFLRETTDRSHGLGWYGSPKPFAGINVDGPVLYGWTGGGVGSMNGGARLALQWDATGNVAIDSGNLNAGSLAPGLLFGGMGSGEAISSRRTAGGNQFALNFHTSFSNRMTILNTGDIGIGTLNPVRRLHIMDGSGPTRAGGSIQVGMASTSGDPKLVYFGDGDFVHIGENGADDTMELKASRFFFTGGNVGIGISDPTNRIAVAGGAYCTGTQWVNASDRNRKEGFQAVNSEEILNRVAALPLSTWSYKDDPSSRHVGPTAQDFQAAFGFGTDDKAIGTVDADGVALAAIQGLNEKLEVRNQKSEVSIQKLQAENAELKRRLEKLEQLMNHENGGAR